MTAAYRLRGLGWFVSTVVVVLGFYLVSLQVAAERKRMEDLDAAIAKAHRDIRQLETEFNTRANMTQLERWNGEILALAAPAADQIMAGEAALANADALVEPHDPARLRAVALVVPAAHAMPGEDAPAVPAAPLPAARPAEVASAIARSPAITPARPDEVVLAVPTAVMRGASAMAPLATRSRAVALLDRRIVRKSRLDDLIRAIPREAGGAR